MVTLYGGSGAGGFSLLGPALSDERARVLKVNIEKVLRARGHVIAADALAAYPFRFYDGTNDFNDEFAVLVATLPLKRYEELRKLGGDPKARRELAGIADVAQELGTYVRFIAADLELKDEQAKADAAGLTRGEIQKVVNNYIGVEGGYLGDFSYRSHHDFYVELDLDIDPNEYEGTTRERFIKILSDSSPAVQARILEGILQRFPIESSSRRTRERADTIGSWIRRLRGRGTVPAAAPRITSAVVERALADAANLLKTSGAVSAVDRVHTALHGWLKAACDEAGIPLTADPNINEVFSALREKHPRLQITGPRADEITKILRALSKIIDSLNTLRNRASVAHPNEQLLDESEAMLVINTAQTLLHFLDARLQAPK
jgi:hypothetical protein